MTSLIIDIQSMPLWFSIPLGIVYLAALAYFIYTLWHYRRKNNLILLLFTIASLASGQSAWAAEKTVTYTLSVESGSSKLTATPDKQCFDGGVKAKNYSISGSSSSLGLGLYDNISITLNLQNSSGTNRMSVSNAGLTCNYAASIAVACKDYYITHIALKNQYGNAISVYRSGISQTNFGFDVDIDIDKYEASGAPAAVQQYNVTTANTQFTIHTITVTYGDTPRSYNITYTNAVNGQNGVTNGNRKTYDVTTADFTITAPTRTGYTFDSFTYTDAAHTTATAASLPMTISRGEAATRKAITFVAAWTANIYTLRLHHNDGTDNYDDVNMTYDVAHTLPALTRTDYVFNGWNTQADGNGTAYTDGQSVSNLAAEQGATVDLYAQWRQVAGSCGDNARWSYDDNGTLSITGTGGTYNFSNGNRPWEQYKDAITTVRIADGITSIGDNAFFNCSNLSTINGGKDLIYVGGAAFSGTLWDSAAIDSTTVVYLGHVAYCGRGVSGDVTLVDGTISIAEYAFLNNSDITSVTIPTTVTTIGPSAFFFCNGLTSVTIPASVTSIGDVAFGDCFGLYTVNVLATTPPTLGYNAFGFISGSINRTFNVRSADYKDASRWTNIKVREEEYSGHNFRLRVISTLTLPDGVTASADAADKVTAFGTDYYAEESEITLSGLGAEHTTGDITYRSRATINYDNVDSNADGQATFWMPDLDATVTVADFPYAVKYIDEDGTKKTSEHPTVIESSNNSQTLNNSDGWYVVLPGEVTISGHLYFENSDAYLILCDGATLTVSDNFNAIQAKDITIYGQTQGSGTVNATGDLCDIDAHDININGGTVNAIGNGNGITANHLAINGGTVNATANGEDNTYGINAGSIILGWTNPTDRIYANSYYYDCTINVNFGQTFWNGTEILSGTLYYYNGDEPTGDLTKLNGKTLEPCNTTPFFIDGTAILLDDDSAQPDGYKNADRIAAMKCSRRVLVTRNEVSPSERLLWNSLRPKPLFFKMVSANWNAGLTRILSVP